MDVDELIDLQWDLSEAAKGPGPPEDTKRPLSERDCNSYPTKALSSDVKRRRVSSYPENDEDDDELLALLQASQLEARPPADANQDDLGALCSEPAADAARQQGSTLQTERSAHAADAVMAPEASDVHTEPCPVLPGRLDGARKSAPPSAGASSADGLPVEASAASAANARSGPPHSTADYAPAAGVRSGPFRSAGDVDGPCISVTGVGGERVYCSMQASTSGREHSARCASHRGQLTQDSIHILMEQVERAAFERALLAGEPSQRSAVGSASEFEQHQDGKHLWVEKYSPRSFLELLGDEEINREVLRWLKRWERCVFGESGGHPAGGAKSRSRAKTGKQALDSRPDERILLICGAPGLGKTTLAHVVARHCGYRPLEINASDDRTATTLVSRINDAVQMQAVIGTARPNCVIIDEIDGAAGGAEGRSAISALLKLLSAGSSKSRDDAENESPGSAEAEPSNSRQKRKGGGSKPLMRPLIAICNDLYAPALRPLRAVAKVVHFKKPAVDRMCSRLKHICGAEGITVNRQALITLCDKTEQDLRSCLNTLQFLAKRKKLICSTDLTGLQCGQKDISKNAFQMWQQLFLDKGTAAAVGSPSAGKALDVQRYDAVADFGEHDLVASGLHENFHAARYLDTHMARTASVLDHLADGDALTARMQRRSDYALLKFAPAHALSIRAIVAGPSRTPIEWPRAQGDAHRRSVIQKALLHSWLMDVTPAVYTAMHPGVAVQEVLPALLTAVGQHVRPVAPHLFTLAERSIMQRMTELLLDHGATLALTGQDAVPVEGMPDVILLSPPLHRLVLFKGIKRECKSLPLSVRQMVVQQVQLEAIKRREAILGPALDGPAAMEAEESDAAPALDASSSQAAEQGSRRPVSGEKAFLLTVAQRAKEAAAAGAKKGGTKQKLSWLDALRHKSEQSKQRRKPEATPSQIAGGHAAAAPAVRYKFHEGYTNAVKRPLKIKDLL